MTPAQAIAQLRSDIAFQESMFREIVDHYWAEWAKQYGYTLERALRHKRNAAELKQALSAALGLRTKPERSSRRDADHVCPAYGTVPCAVCGRKDAQ